ncbi:MAG: lysozyme family protein, partial [Eubacterium sp.]|nr:lysozyme family protein [Eubacterium sp.]
MKRRDTAEQTLIEGLSNIARRRYEMLSETDKKKLLRRADYIADKLEVKGYVRKEQISQTRRNSLAEKSMGDARAFNVRASAGGYGRGDDIKAGMSMSSNSVRRVGRTYILTVEYLLRSSPDPAGSERPDGDENEETYQNIAKIVHAGGDVASLRRHAGNGRDFKSEVKAFEGDISKKQKRNSFGRRQAGKKKSASRQRKNLLSKKLTKRRVKKKAAKDAGQATKRMSKAIQKVKKVLKKIMSKVVAMNPLAHLFALITLIIVIIAVMIGAVVAAFSGAGSNGSYLSYEAKVSERTESYRPLLEKYCEKYGIADYVELCLAMIEQESSGNPPDVMQTEQSYYNTHPPIDTPEESIDCGSHELADCLKKAGCTGPDDIENISLAIQGYNFGNGYIDWALKHYKGYSAENAK